eukprot:1237795-Alexandrium_andersonii.AAC.1
MSASLVGSEMCIRDSTLLHACACARAPASAWPRAAGMNALVCTSACVRFCMRACVRACVQACARACVCA